MENTDQPLSASPTLLNPSPDDKENHPPLFTDFHTRDIIHYFDAKFETFDQYLLYLQRHLSDWQSDPHFQHFHMAYVHYPTMNDHIESLGKTLKTMEKTRDNLKGTMNRLSPLLHEKGLQNKIRSITNHTQSPSISFADPISESISDDSALSYTSTSPEPLPVPPPRRRNEQEFCQTCKYPLKYNHILWAMGRDDYDGCTCRCPKPEKDTPDTEPIAVPEMLEPRPTYPCNLSTPLCKKCNAFHIKQYCLNFTCPYCWTAAPGHWLNKCTKKTFQKHWWEKNAKESDDQDSTHSWDNCHGHYDISREEDGNLNGEC